MEDKEEKLLQASIRFHLHIGILPVFQPVDVLYKCISSCFC